MDLGISGRAALVAGGTSGLGRAAARALATEGCAVAICGRDEARLASTAAELRDLGAVRVHAHPVELSDPRAVEEWVVLAAAALGGVHIVISNSGGPPPGPVDAFGVDAYRNAVDVAVLPHIGLTLAALPHLRKAGWGRVVLVASETVRQPIPAYGLSSTVRPALLGFARSLVQTLGAGDVTVNVIAPGYHDTPGLRRQFGDAASERLAEIGADIPVGRVGRPEDFGATVAFLVGQHASFITGTCLLVDGGATRGIG